jgi:hypothetical protein
MQVQGIRGAAAVTGRPLPDRHVASAQSSSEIASRAARIAASAERVSWDLSGVRKATWMWSGLEDPL